MAPTRCGPVPRGSNSVAVSITRLRCRSTQAQCPRCYLTRKIMLLVSAPLGVITWTVPVVAPAGTVAWMSECDSTVNVAAAIPLKVTLVAPVRLLPRILIVCPTLPDVGSVVTYALSPTERLKTVPSPLAPSAFVVP